MTTVLFCIFDSSCFDSIDVWFESRSACFCILAVITSLSVSGSFFSGFKSLVVGEFVFSVLSDFLPSNEVFGSSEIARDLFLLDMDLDLTVELVLINTCDFFNCGDSMWWSSS